jgi:hypothetical protein
MRRSLIAGMTLASCALTAQAVDWVCTVANVPTRVAIASADLPDGATASGAAVGAIKRVTARGRSKIDRADLLQAYSGQPVLLGHTWLLAVMLPANHPDTRQAFGELGISAEAAERMASGAGLVDRGIRVVQTPAQMMDKLATNPPAVGYTGFFTGGRDVAPCF